MGQEEKEFAGLLDMLTENEKSMLQSNATEFELEKNQSIYRSGQDARYVYLIHKGRVKISTSSAEEKEVLKNLIHEGEMLGEGALFGEDSRRDSASAMDGGTVVWQIPIEHMKSVMKSNPEFSFKVTAQIAQKLQSAERRLESLTFQNSRTRIIEFLKETARKQGKKIGYETLLRPFLTHQDIGNLTTTSRQTVSSVLNELKGSNKIYYDRHRLLIRDMSVL